MPLTSNNPYPGLGCSSFWSLQHLSNQTNVSRLLWNAHFKGEITPASGQNSSHWSVSDLQLLQEKPFGIVIFHESQSFLGQKTQKNQNQPNWLKGHNGSNIKIQPQSHWDTAAAQSLGLSDSQLPRDEEVYDVWKTLLLSEQCEVTSQQDQSYSFQWAKSLYAPGDCS